MPRDPEEGSFAAAINRASAVPDDVGVGATQELPSIFKSSDFPIPQGDHVQNMDSDDDKKIQGIPAYKYKANIKRFLIGPISQGRDERGMPVIVEHDDSIAYQEVLNEILAGRAVLQWDDKKVTNEGGLIVAMVWLIPKEEPRSPKPDPMNPENYDRQ
jgi:hypothetical protein